MDRLADVSISGMGSSNGGVFSNVDISGMGTIHGDVEAERISISGKGTIEGNVAVFRRVEISGMGTIRGSVKGGQLVSSGSGNVEGIVDVELIESAGNLKVGRDAKVKELSNAGRCRFDLSVRGDKIESYGLLSVGNDLEAETFYSQGSFTVGGLLNANRVDIEIHGFCQAREIGGEEIRVRSNGWGIPLLNKLINPFLGSGRELDRLTADVIEGTVVSLSYTTAKVVRGNKIVIGPECKIDEVEYTDSVEVDPRACVGKQTKL
ncbi:MAG TPA: polymer-forming cytoskeletal protein [Verrucomicrobiae bacterium]|nr:polymer-forming cytoskeletal protein [Verrucomicrobiae bacterium]